MKDKKSKERQKSEGEKVIYFPAQRKNSAGFGANFFNKSKSKEPFFNFGIVPIFTKCIFWLLLLIHIGAYLLLDDGNKFSMYYTFGFIPDTLTKFTSFTYLTLLTPVTSLFLHSSWMHLIFNLLMLLSMGLYFERLFGAWKTLQFFILCGIAGNLCFLILSPSSGMPVVGASGAINGLFAFTFMHMQRSGLMGPSITEKGPLPFILLWLSLILFTGIFSGDLSWQSHLGGFIAGIAIFNLWKNGHIKTWKE